MTIKLEDTIQEIQINQIDVNGWDARRYEEDSQEFSALVESVRRDGLIHPIIVRRQGSKYQIVVGRRRLKACEKAGLQTIIAQVKPESFSDIQVHKTTFFENLHRKKLEDLEKAYGILQMYQDHGYTPHQVIQGLKHLHNQESDEKKAPKKRLYTGIRTDSTFIPDSKFIDISNSIGYSPNYQYAKVQYAIQVETKVMEQADKKKLSTKKKTLLTNTSLRNHPNLQISLVEQIENMTDDQARLKINQTIHDLKTGYLKPSESGRSYSYDDPNKHEKISQQKNELQNIESFQVNTEVHCQKLLYTLTGYTLSKNQLHYTDENVKNTHTHRLQIAKSMNSDLRSLRLYKKWFLNPAYLALQDMIEIVDSEIETAENKQEMLKK